MKLYELLCEMAGRLKSIRQVPTYDEQDVNCVLMCANTEEGPLAQWEYIEQIPEYNTVSDHNKVLSVSNNEEPYLGWRAVNEVPTQGTTGNVLTKTASGYEWTNLSPQLEAIVTNYMETHYENGNTAEY